MSDPRPPIRPADDDWPPVRDYHNEIRAERDQLRAEVERLTRERDNWKAHAISRGKRLRQARDRFICIKDEIENEGDRVYFGSTNHADEFREEVAWLDDFKWDKIMGEPEDWDLLGALNKQTARAEAAEREMDELIKAVAEARSRPDALRADKAEARAETAERKLAMAVEAIRPLAPVKPDAFDGDSLCILQIGVGKILTPVGYWKYFMALRTVLTELEESDD